MMMTSTLASAPAKIILFGEHFVVYNQPIILASINKRMKIECKIEEEMNKTLTIETNHFGKKTYPLSIIEKNNHYPANDFFLSYYLHSKENITSLCRTLWNNY